MTAVVNGTTMVAIRLMLNRLKLSLLVKIG